MCLGPFGVSVGGGEGQGREGGEAAGHSSDGLGGDAVEAVDGFAAGEGMAVKLGGAGYGYGGVFLVVTGYDHLAEVLATCSRKLFVGEGVFGEPGDCLAHEPSASGGFLGVAAQVDGEERGSGGKGHR